MELLENGQAVTLNYGSKPAITSPDLQNKEVNPGLPTGFWMHEEDFYTESLFKKDEFKCVFISSEPVKSAVKKTWLDTAKADASARCRNHFQGPVSEGELKDLISWAKENGISQIVTMRQDVGPINDQLYKLDGINIIFEDREEDLRFRPLTKAGFFGFWKKIEPILKEPLQ